MQSIDFEWNSNAIPLSNDRVRIEMKKAFFLILKPHKNFAICLSIC